MTLDLRFVLDNYRISRLAWTAMDHSYGLVNQGDPLVAIDNTGTGRPQPFEAPTGFVAREVITDPTTNFKTVIYQNADTNEVVVSLMGTNGWGDIKGWNTNLTSYGREQWTTVYKDPSNPEQLSNGDRVFKALAGYVDGNTKLIVAGDSKGVMLGQYFTDELAHRIAGRYDLIGKPWFGEGAGTENLLSLRNDNIMFVGHNGAGIAEQMNRIYPGWQANDPALNGIGFFYSSTPGELVSMIGGALLGNNGNLFYYGNGGNYDPLYLHRLADSGWDFFKAGGGFGDMVEMSRQQADVSVIAQLGSAVAGLFRNGSGFTDPEAGVNLLTAVTAGLVFAPPGSTYEVVSKGFQESLGETGAAVAGGVAEVLSWFARAGLVAQYGIGRVVGMIAGMGTSGKVLGMVGDRLTGETGAPITLDKAIILTGAPIGVDPSQRNLVGFGADGVLRVVDVTDGQVNVYAFSGTQRYQETWRQDNGDYELRNGNSSYIVNESGKYLLLDGGPERGVVRVDIPAGADVKPFGAGGFKFEYTDSEGIQIREIVRLNGDYSLSLASSSGGWVETSRGNYVDPDALNTAPDWDNGLLGAATNVFGIYRVGGMYEYSRDNTEVMNGVPVSYREYAMKDATGKPVEWLQIREDGTASLIQAHASISFNASTRSLVMTQDNSFGNGTVGVFKTDAQGHPIEGYAALSVGSGSSQTVIRVSFGLSENGDSVVNSVKFANGASISNETDVIQGLNNIGYSPRNVTTLDQDEPTSIVTEQAKEILGTAAPGGVHTLQNAIGQYGGSLLDALSLVKAIQSGEPLPILASGLRLANDISNLNGMPNLELSGAASAASGILSLMSLSAALERGDTLGAITAGAQAVTFGATAYANFVGFSGNNALQNAISAGEFGAAGEALGAIGKALPYLSLINAIANGDEAGVAVSTLTVLNSAGVFAAESALAVAIPYIGWAYAVYSIIDSLFGDEPDIPDPWGSGRYVWNGTGISYQSVGETGGNEAVANVMGSVLSTLNALIERERQQNPGAALGIIPNRMPGVGYDMSGYRYTDIDPLTGAEQHPGLRFDTAGRPYNAAAGSPESWQSLGEGMVRSALARGAIAPLWEVATAKLQTDAGDPKAGLTEEERAGRDGQLAAPIAGSTQTFRPVALDLDGDGIETTTKADGVAFDVDDSGYLKETAWIKGDDAFLTLDRDYNGQFDSGRELFSNGTVALGRRGLAGMAWVDSNYDGRLTATDPVWSELKVWRDLDQDGTQDTGEVQGLDALGVSELNYAMGTFTQAGQQKQLASPDLDADAPQEVPLGDKEGTRVSVVPEGILVQASGNGHLSLLVTRIDDKTAVEASRDGIASFEDLETIVSGTDLLANDSLAGFLGRDLSIPAVMNPRHGTVFLDVNGFVHFTPEAKCLPRTSGHRFKRHAANDGRMEWAA